MKEIRFKQLAATYDGEDRRLYGLTEDGRVYFYDATYSPAVWQSMSMLTKEVT